MIEPRYDAANNIAEFEVAGSISTDDYVGSIKFLQKIIDEQDDKVNVIMTITEPGAVSPGVFFNKEVLTGLTQLNKIQSAAIVVDHSWSEKLAEVVTSVLPYESKIFSLDDRVHAKEWLLKQKH